MVKDRRPYVLSRCHNTWSRFSSVKRSCLWSDKETQWMVKYVGAWPFRHQCTKTTITWTSRNHRRQAGIRKR